MAVTPGLSLADALVPVAPASLPLVLWRLDLDSVSDGDEAWSLLSASERARATRFRFDIHRRRFAVGRAALRLLLADAIGEDPSQLLIGEGRYGKPFTPGREDLGFNLSHSEGTALIALGERPCGVDIECFRPFGEPQALARRLYTPREIEEMPAFADPTYMRAFLTIWTRKEAVLKAIGSGLAVEPISVHVGLGRQPSFCELEFEQGRYRVTFRSIDLSDSLVAAVAWVDGTDVDSQTP